MLQPPGGMVGTFQGSSRFQVALYQATDEFGRDPGLSRTNFAGLLLLTAILVVALLSVRAWAATRGRSRIIRKAAREAGFHFEESNARLATNRRFDMFMEGTTFEPTSILRQRRGDGTEVVAFDYQLIVEWEHYRTPDGKKHRRRAGQSNAIGGAAISKSVDRLDTKGSAATIKFDAFVRNVLIIPRAWDVSTKSRLADKDVIGPRGTSFDTTFMVRSDDAPFAEEFVTFELCEFLLALGGRFGLEVRGNQLMLFAPHVGPEDMPDLARLVGVCLDHLDKELLARHPDRSGGKPLPKMAEPEDEEPEFPTVEQASDLTGPVLGEAAADDADIEPQNLVFDTSGGGDDWDSLEPGAADVTDGSEGTADGSDDTAASTGDDEVKGVPILESNPQLPPPKAPDPSEEQIDWSV